MSDAAAFFAKKKGKKKKAFKGFNANKIDISKVTPPVQLEVSSDAQIPSMNSLSISNNNTNEQSGDWDEAANGNANVVANASGPEAAELMDMNALKMKRNEQDDIAERLRVEETRAKLAAAREGMEKEAKRLKDEKDSKEAKKQTAVQGQSGRFGAAAGNVSAGIGGLGGGGKWVPVHMRNSAASRPTSSGPRFGAAASNTGFQRKVDTNDDELFPDLGTASKLIQEEEDLKAAAAAAKSAAFARKARAEAQAKRVADKLLEDEELKREEEAKVAAEKAEEEAKAVAAAAASAAPTPVKKKKKKKKKDLSSFSTS